MKSSNKRLVLLAITGNLRKKLVATKEGYNSNS
jgi:hypothetical protein